MKLVGVRGEIGFRLLDAVHIADMQPVTPTVLKPELVNPSEFWDR